MTKWLLALALLCAGAGTGWYLLHRSSNAAPESDVTHHASRVTPNEALTEPRLETNAATTPQPVSPAPALASSVTLAPPAPAQETAPTPDAAPLPFSDLPAATVVENMRTAFRSYISMFGANPVGTNPEITRALNGENPKQARFIKAEDGLRINSRGELVDAWGTAFFFHQLSGTLMEIHSAGPDRKMWTADDLVTK